MLNKEKQKIDSKNLNMISEMIQNQLIKEFKLDNIGMLAEASAGNIKKLILKRPLSLNFVVNKLIDKYLDHYDVEVIKKY